MADTTKRLSKFIRTYMKENNISSKELAEALGVSIATIERWRWGKCSPKYDKFKQVAEYFELDIATAAVMATKTDEHEHMLTYMLDCLHLVLGISMREMLSVIGIDSSTYCNWKENIAHPSLTNIIKISKTLSWDANMVDQMGYRLVPYSLNENLLLKASGSFMMAKGRKDSNAGK